MDRTQKKGLNSSFIYSTIFIGLGVLYIYLKGTPIYAVNDDLLIRDILSGAYLGVPSAYVVYIQYPLSFILKSLYQLNQSIPWYGGFLLSCHLAAGACLIQRCTNKVKSEISRFGIFAFIVGLFVVADLSQIIILQYTVTAAIVGSTALFWFITSDSKHGNKRFFTDNIITIVFMVLAFCIRKNVLLMFLPFAGMIWLGKWINEERPNDKKIFFCEKKLSYLGLALIIGIAISAVFGIHKLAYSSKEWKEYTQYNDARVKIYDYYGWPEYAQNQVLYDSLGITNEAYEGAVKRYLLNMDNNITTETLSEIANWLEQNYDNTLNFKDTIKKIGKVGLEDLYLWSDRPLNLLVVGFYVLIFVCSFIGRNKRAFIAMGCLIVGRFVSWAYIIIEGRIPIRVTQSLFLAEFFILVGIALHYEIWNLKKLNNKRLLLYSKKITMLVAAIVYFFAVMYIGKQNFLDVQNYVDRRQGTTLVLGDVIKYCEERPDNFYFIDNVSISFLTDEVLNEEGYLYQNYMIFGGWLTASPTYKEKIQVANIKDVEKDILESEQIYVIVQDNPDFTIDYLLNYYAGKYDTFAYSLEDYFSTNGFNFKVYQLRK